MQSSLPQLEPEEAAEEAAAEETLIGGYFLEAAFLDNPSFTARPDNTGLVLLRHDLHLETDLFRQYLTLYTDQNFLSDRNTGGIKLTEHDQIYGVSGLLGRHVGWLIQYEDDAPLDRSGLTQSYAVAMMTYRINAEQDWPWWRRTFPKQYLNLYAGPGWHFANDHYFARPDNTGVTLFRYIGHVDLGLYRDRATFWGKTGLLNVLVFGDMNMNTDREARSVIRPSELDWIVGVAVRWEDKELSLYREQDRPLDRSGFVQQYIAVQMRLAFDLSKRNASTLWKKIRQRRSTVTTSSDRP